MPWLFPKNSDIVAMKFPSYISFQRIMYAVGTISGAFLSAYLSGNIPSTIQIDMSPNNLVLGGLLVIVGSKIGGGCTSGHGVSGFSMGNKTSWIFVPSMFVGGLLTGLIIN
jgi:uncharacterized membrane protein YedE/YeeE